MYLLGVLQAVVIFGFGLIVGVKMGDLLGVVLVTLVFILVGCSLGLMISALARREENVQLLGGPIGLVMAAQPTPFWLDSRDAPEAREPLRGEVACDLAVVGGGFGGLWAALLAKEANPGRARLLEQLFYSGPAFYGVTGFTELRVFVEPGPYDPALFQTQDYAQWIRLIKKYDFEILPDPLYQFRIRTGWENLSGPQVGKQIRGRNEMYLVMKSFFRDMPTELFREAFRRRLINPDFSSDTERASGLMGAEPERVWLSSSVEGWRGPPACWCAWAG